MDERIAEIKARCLAAKIERETSAVLAAAMAHSILEDDIPYLFNAIADEQATSQALRNTANQYKGWLKIAEAEIEQLRDKIKKIRAVKGNVNANGD